MMENDNTRINVGDVVDVFTQSPDIAFLSSVIVVSVPATNDLPWRFRDGKWLYCVSAPCIVRK